MTAVIDSGDMTREEEQAAINRVEFLVGEIEDLIQGERTNVVLTTLAHVLASTSVQALTDGHQLGEIMPQFMRCTASLMPSYADALRRAVERDKH